MNVLPRRALTCLLLALLVPAAPAHDDDPKILSKQARRPGPGFRAALAADPGSLAATSFGPPSGPVFLSPVGFGAQQVTLLSWLPLPEFGPQMSNGADCWGYTSPSGREYAIIGLSNGTGFVEITQPDDAQIVAVMPGPSSLWKDAKVYQSYAYSVSEGGDGIQVFDLSQIDDGVVTHVIDITSGGGSTATHNVAVDETSGRLYRCGGGDNGLRIYSLANPAVPTFLGSWPDRYVHDAQVYTYTSGPNAGKQIAFCATGYNGGSTDPGIDILDVTNPGAILNLSRFVYPNASYAHQCWLSADGTRLYVDDEWDEFGNLPTTTYVLNVANLSQPSLAGSFTNGNPAVGHNLYVRDNLLFEANYRSGLRVFDVGVDPVHPPEVAWFDTYPADDLDEYNALWSVYPYFPSRIVVGSDMEKGLFVWHVGPPKVAFTDLTPVPQALDPAGGSWTVHVQELSAGDLLAGSGRLHVDTGEGWVSLPLAPLGGGDFLAALPPMPCGWTASFYLSAQSSDGITWTSPSVAGGEVHRAPVARAAPVVLFHDMESSGQGWVSGAPGDDATTGHWERGDPRGTEAQPTYDHTEPGTDCWFTGQGPQNGGVGDADVDNGTTTLLSPILDLSGVTEARIVFWLWYVNGYTYSGSQPDDVFVIDISNDGGSSWTNVETVAPQVKDTPPEWTRHEFRVADVVAPTSQMRLRFVASDLGVGSIVEAAVDDFAVIEYRCRDCDDDGVSDAMAVLQGAVDANGNGIPDACDGFGPAKRPTPGGAVPPNGTLGTPPTPGTVGTTPLQP